MESAPDKGFFPTMKRFFARRWAAFSCVFSVVCIVGFFFLFLSRTPLSYESSGSLEIRRSGGSQESANQGLGILLPRIQQMASQESVARKALETFSIKAHPAVLTANIEIRWNPEFPTILRAKLNGPDPNLVKQMLDAYLPLFAQELESMLRREAEAASISVSILHVPFLPTIPINLPPRWHSYAIVLLGLLAGLFTAAFWEIASLGDKASPEPASGEPDPK